MMIHELTALVPPFKRRKRVGRGKGSGRGKTATRGQKGAGSRRGHSTRFAFEGGQMPFFRRMPKMGFTNANFRTEFWAVNLADIIRHKSFSSGGDVTPETLVKAGLVRDSSRPVKVMGDLRGVDGGVKVKLNVNVHRITGPAKKHIVGAGGSVTEAGTRRDRVRGVDRNGDDQTPRNLTKKLKGGARPAARRLPSRRPNKAAARSLTPIPGGRISAATRISFPDRGETRTMLKSIIDLLRLNTIINVFKVPELRTKILFTLGMLAVYRIGFWIPLPGINQAALIDYFKTQAESGSASAGPRTS